MEILHLLEKLTQNCGVAGYEKPIADLLEDEIKDIGPVRRTPLGSLICTVKQESPDKPHVVLEAHMDEIGLMVCDIDDRGFLKVTRCGGIDRRVATASPVIIHGKNGDRRGIVASEEQNPAKNPTLEQLYVDAGVSREQAEKEFPIGTRISYIGSFKHLLEGNVSSKALDDRCGCAAMITAARMLKEMDTDCSITLLLSVMEEVGGMGAATGANALQPITHCISVDVSFALTPELQTHQGGKLGDGPMVGHNPILSREVSEDMAQVGTEQGITHQVKVYAGYRTGTDADGIILAGAGAKGACTCIPLRYMHTPVEVINAADMENTAKLAAAYVAQKVRPEGGCR
ncbi:M42 family metallopeptidase [Negativibacillus massiliensis]|uniref:M42 family metallopeptidase n=1 Tax=Negativibacillus massiliensis TaxID=1871035 RepID=UPI003AF2379C